MKTTKPNALLIWKQLEDFVVPRLALSVVDRTIYAYLLRHSRLEGKPSLRFSIAWLARGTRLSGTPTRASIRRLVARGALRLIERTKAGHVVEVRLPQEILAASPAETSRDKSAPAARPFVLAHDLDSVDFLQTTALRDSIHQRERDLCFYCMRRLTPDTRCLDHVIPQAMCGVNSYRNLVSACIECNSQKGEQNAPDFLRRLLRDRQLTSEEFAARLRTLDALAAGNLRPTLDTTPNPTPRLGRPPVNRD